MRERRLAFDLNVLVDQGGLVEAGKHEIISTDAELNDKISKFFSTGRFYNENVDKRKQRHDVVLV